MLFKPLKILKLSSQMTGQIRKPKRQSKHSLLFLSDLLFMFLITASLVFSSRILEQRGELETRKFIYLGIVLGLIPLARPLGFYYILVVPLFLLASLWISSEVGTTNWVRMIKGLFLAGLIASIVMMPWCLRNSQVFGKFSLTQSEGIMMKWHYQSLNKYISLGPNHDHLYYLDLRL